MTGIGVLKSLLPRKRSCAQQEGVVSEVSQRELQLEIYTGLCKKDIDLGSTCSLRPVKFYLFILLMKINSGIFGVRTLGLQEKKASWS